ncbi:methyltransferase domain-containing protein [Mycoplasmatota bacterium]|nr:methyltransferase domain-containing protein [Mycoplasmatota bacterium]
MNLERILRYSKTLIKSCTGEGDLVIDATVGNGNDTLFLSQLVKENGHVFGFDIQEQAINQTKKLLGENNCQNVSLFQIGHEQLKKTIPLKYHGQIASAIFNLGYLPHGDKSITTKKETTIIAIQELLLLLKLNGIIILVIYSGHPEGKEEKETLLNYVKTLNQKQYQVLMYRFINQINDAPFIIAIEKIKELS